MFCLTCTILSTVDLAPYGVHVPHAKDWVYVRYLYHTHIAMLMPGGGMKSFYPRI